MKICNFISSASYFKEIEETCCHFYQKLLEIFRSIFSLAPAITVESYKEYCIHPQQLLPSHIELGASNYGSDCTCLGTHYKTTSSHRLDFLYVVSAYVVRQFHQNCVLFLNDLSDPGLNEAAERLKMRLQEKMKSGEIPRVNVRIVKIAQNILTFQDWPKVNSAHFFNPFDFPTQRLVYAQADRVTQVVAKALSRIVRTSQTGLYVSDINWKPTLSGDKGKLQQQLTEERSLPLLEGMYLHPRKIAELSDLPYIFPNGDKKLDTPLCYQLTLNR